MTIPDYTTADAARRLGIGERTVRYGLIRKLFPGAYCHGGRWFIPAAAVESYRLRHLGRPGAPLGNKNARRSVPRETIKNRRVEKTS